MKIRTLAALIFAGAIGAALGDATHSAKVQAQSVGVTMICLDAIQNFGPNQVPTNVTQHCVQSVNDTSGLTSATLTFTAPTQRYAIGVSGTVTLP